MKTNRNVWIILVPAFLLSIFSFQGLNESQNAGKQIDQFYPAIYGDYVVWEDNRNGNWDIYGCKITHLMKKPMKDGEDFPIIKSAGNQLSPAIYKDIVVWEDNRHGNWDIYVRKLEGEYEDDNDVLKENEFQKITSAGNQLSPAIYKDYVVWEDNRHGNWDIYGCKISYDDSGRISVEKEFQITTSKGDQRNPAIYGDYVVWEDNRHGNWDIYSYNFSTAQELQITTDLYSQRFPAIYDGTVVWMDQRDYNWNIYGYKFSKESSTNNEEDSTIENSDEQSKVFPIITNQNEQRSPAIHGNYVVYHDNRHKNWNIFVYDLSKKEEIQNISSATASDDLYPAIHGDYVVYMFRSFGFDDPSKDKNTNWCIYVYDIDKKEDVSLKSPEYKQPSSLDKNPHYFASAGVAVAFIPAILLLYGTAKKYTKKTFEYNPKSKIYGVNACKDPISNFLLGRWDVFFIILALFFFALVLTGLFYRNLNEIDINSLPREKVALLNEEAEHLPIFKDPQFFLTFLIPIAILYPAIRFFRYIPRVFEELFNNEIITKKGHKKADVLPMLNESLEEVEKNINKKYMYVCGFFFGFVAFLIYLSNIQNSSQNFVYWGKFSFFPVTSVAYMVVAVSLFFMFGIFIWKMCCVVFFLWKLNRDYDLVLKPYDIDGSGGFAPLEELWLRMSYLAIPVLAIPILLFFLHQSFGTPFNPLSVSVLSGIVIIGLLVVPAWSYHDIIEKGKTNLLKRIEEKIKVYQTQIEEELFDTKKDLDDHCLKEIRKLENVIADVKNIHSLPFKRYQKAYITLSAILPWIPRLISYLA